MSLTGKQKGEEKETRSVVKVETHIHAVASSLNAEDGWHRALISHEHPRHKSLLARAFVSVSSLEILATCSCCCCCSCFLRPLTRGAGTGAGARGAGAGAGVGICAFSSICVLARSG